MPLLVPLVEELLAYARDFDALLARNNIPPTSFENDTLEALPSDVQKLRLNLLDSSHNLRQLVQGASLSGLEVAYNWTDAVVLRIIWRYELASFVPIGGTASYQEISALSGLRKSLVTRTIRAAIPMRIFDERTPGLVSHTAISRLLATHEGYYNAIGLQVEDLGPASIKLIESWERFGEATAEPDQSAFSLSNGGQSLSTVLAQHPDRANRFDLAMEFIATESDNVNISSIVKAFDWTLLDEPGSRLIDLGGGYGQVSQLLAQRTSHLVFIVQDLPHVTKRGQENLPDVFKSRIVFEARSFMDPQPPGTALPDTFLISRCLHNWCDFYSVRILQALVPALRRGSRILIWDSVLDDYPAKSRSQKFSLQQDLIMATISNGKDRTLKDYRRLLELADARFIIKSVTRPQGCQLSMLEILWNG